MTRTVRITPNGDNVLITVKEGRKLISKIVMDKATFDAKIGGLKKRVKTKKGKASLIKKAQMQNALPPTQRNKVIIDPRLRASIAAGVEADLLISLIITVGIMDIIDDIFIDDIDYRDYDYGDFDYGDYDYGDYDYGDFDFGGAKKLPKAKNVSVTKQKQKQK